MKESPGHHERFMSMALALAGRSRPSPNPRVGAVIVKDGEVVGSGYHRAVGEPHAEINAIAQAGMNTRGADLYVTLEPCCHHGRTGPCTEAIIAAGISTVYVGMTDPDKQVCGKGNAILKSNGIQIVEGLMETACTDLLAGYIHHRIHGQPLVTLKAAITLDGFIATRAGESRWISCPESRQRVHEMRAWHDAVLVGVNTVIADNPMLTVRNTSGASPVRIILDSSLRTPTDAQLLSSAADVPVIIAYSNSTSDRVNELSAIGGVTLLKTSADSNGRVDIAALLPLLGKRGIMALLVEGGGKVHGDFIRAGLANRFSLFIAPKMLGDGIPWAPFTEARNMAEAIQARSLRSEMSGTDILLSGEF